MTYFMLILFVAAFFYLLIGLLMHAGLSKKVNRSNRQPLVSVLVAARNEEETLTDCLDSLAMSNYPPDRYEVIIIDDRSTDHTAEIARTYSEQFKNFRFHQVKNDLHGLRGKINALAQAIDLSSGEIILITDADCRVEKNWLAGMITSFTEQTAMVGGLTLIRPAADNYSLFQWLQSLDLLFLQAIASGTAGIGLPVSILGNNFGFKKAVYQEIGGFRQIGFTLTEDMALMQEIVSHEEFRLAYPLQPQVIIETKPLQNFSEFYSQRKRWLHGGKKSSAWGYLLMSTAFITHQMVLVSFIIGIWTFSLLLLIMVIGLVDFSLILRLTRRSKQNGMLKFFPLFELFFTGYSLLVAFSLLWPKTVDWKGRKYGGR